MIKPVPEADSIQDVMHPTGFRILVRVLMPEEESKSLIEMPQEIRDREWFAQMKGEVMELGPQAYRDDRKFPTGPWCKRGDCIIMRPYTGTRFMVRGHLYALVNDDSICGVVVGDPGEVSRA
jgi:co-chaperonin GroES (HSP10)